MRVIVIMSNPGGELDRTYLEGNPVDDNDITKAVRDMIDLAGTLTVGDTITIREEE